MVWRSPDLVSCSQPFFAVSICGNSTKTPDWPRLYLRQETSRCVWTIESWTNELRRTHTLSHDRMKCKISYQDRRCSPFLTYSVATGNCQCTQQTTTKLPLAQDPVWAFSVSQNAFWGVWAPCNLPTVDGQSLLWVAVHHYISLQCSHLLCLHARTCWASPSRLWASRHSWHHTLRWKVPHWRG